MRRLLEITKSFVTAEDGAVMVDWVVLTAAMVGLGMAAMMVVSGGVEDVSGEVATELASLEVGISGFTSDASGSALTEWTPFLQEGADGFAADAVLMSDGSVTARMADIVGEFGGVPPFESEMFCDEYHSLLNEAETRGLV